MAKLDLHIQRNDTSLRHRVTDRLPEAILYEHFEPGENW